MVLYNTETNMSVLHKDKHRHHRVYPASVVEHLVRLREIYQPIIEYIELVLEENKINPVSELELDFSLEQVKSVYHIITRLNDIIILKCEKKQIKILNVDMLMDYTDVLCDMLLENTKTSNIYDIMTLVGCKLESHLVLIGQEDPEMEMQRWRIMYSLLSEKVKNENIKVTPYVGQLT